MNLSFDVGWSVSHNKSPSQSQVTRIPTPRILRRGSVNTNIGVD